MKYFKNITTAEEIKKQFRAYCVSMHPDKGGDPDFNSIKVRLERDLRADLDDVIVISIP